MTAICRSSNIIQRVTVPRIIDRYGRKRCQKKRKDVNYELLEEFFQKYFGVHEQAAVKNSLSTSVCYAPGRFILVESVETNKFVFVMFT